MKDLGFSYKDNDFSAVGKAEGESVVLELAGTADARAVDHLGRVLRGLHEHAIAHQTRHVTVDFRAAEFMNSSCFKAFVVWLDAVQGAPAERQYKIKFLSNPEFHWQRRSLHALACFAADLIALEPVSP